MIVYVAESGVYEHRGICGIYDSPERAIGHLHRPGMVWTRELWHFQSDPKVRGGGSEEWTNNKDWDDYITIHAHAVGTDGELRSPDKITAAHDGEKSILYEELTADQADALVAKYRR